MSPPLNLDLASLPGLSSRSQHATRRDLLACACAVTALALWSVVRWYIEEQAWLDDAWISFKYSRALISGEGLTYNLEDGPVEGFTNLAWVVLTAAGMKLGAPPELFARTLGLLSHLIAITLIATLGWRRGAGLGANKVAAVVIAAIPGATHGLLGIAGSGLETAFAALLLVLLAELTENVRPLPVVLVSFLLCTTRPDGLLFVSCWFGVMLVFHRRRWRTLALSGLLFAIPMAAVLAWKLNYFGSLVPNTYFAKSADLPSWTAGWAFWQTFSQSEPGAVGLTLLLMALPFRFLRAWSAFALASLTLYVIYVAKVGGDFMEYRFAFQVLPLLAWSAARGLIELRAEGSRLVGVALASACLGFGLLPPVLEHRFGAQSIELMNLFVIEGRSVGARLNEVLPPDTRLSTTLAGSLPFEWRGFVVDEWGLTDPYVARLPSRPVVTRGHVKFAPVAYLQQRGVNLVLDHPAICSCEAGCDAPWPQVYVRLAGDRCLRTRYLVPTPALTRLFCSSPHFLVRHVDCAPEPLPTWSAVAGAKVPEAEVASSWERLDPAEFFRGRRGVAFGSSIVPRALPGQTPVSGHRAGLFNSFHGGDESTGWLRWTPDDGAVRLRGRVGGGADCNRVYLGVLREGRLEQTVCGQNTEALQPFELALTPGAEVVMVDMASEGWGHLLVSDLELGRGPAPKGKPARVPGPGGR